MLALLKMEGLGGDDGDDIKEYKDSNEYNDEEKKISEEIEDLSNKIKDKKMQLNANSLVKNINMFNEWISNDKIAKKDPKYTNPSIKMKNALKGHFGKVQALAWSSDSNELVSASQDGKILVWNVQSGNKRLAIPLLSPWCMCVDWSNDCRLIASGGLDDVCSIYNIENDHTGWVNKKAQSELVQHQGYISSCKFINNNRILTCSGDSSIIFWDIEYKKALNQLKHHSADVNSIDLCNDNNTFVSVSCDSTCKVWDLRNEGRPIYSFEGLKNDINSVRWFPDYKSFAVACDDGESILYDWNSRQKIVSYSNNDLKCNAIGIDFSKSGSYLFATYDGDPWCILWNTLTAKMEQQLNHVARPSAMQMSPDGHTFATGSWDKKIRLWQ